MSEKYNKILNVVELEINQMVSLLSDCISVEEPLKTRFLEVLNAPSKHIRPLVSFLYLKALGENINEQQILYQTAIELVHNASLIHDDVIDEGEVRRGVRTLNNSFDSKLAVISGDYLLSVALDKVLQIGDIRLVKILKDTLECMCNGEISQYFNRFSIPTLDDYIKKSEQKTAKLFEAALCGALLIANRECDAFFAKSFGIAFQIRDDLINYKTVNSDIKDGVYTAPVIYSGSMNVSDEAIEKTKILLNNYIRAAIECLSNIEDNKYKRALIELLELMKYE